LCTVIPTRAIIVEKLHTLNNLMPNQIAAVKNACVAGVDALAAFASGIHAASGTNASAGVSSGLKLSELEVAFVTDAIPEKYRDKFAPYFEYLGTPVKDRKPFDFGDLAPEADVVDSRGNDTSDSTNEKPVSALNLGAGDPTAPDRSAAAEAGRAKKNGPDLRLVAIEAIGRLRGTFLGLCG